MNFESHLNETLGDLNSGVFQILKKSMGDRWALAPQPVSEFSEVWGAETHSLHQSSMFLDLGKAQQQSILNLLNEHLLKEALFIEKCGLFSAARLSLLATKPEEKMLYNFFAADESVHFYWFSSLWKHQLPGRFEDNAFLTLIESVSRECSRPVVVNVLQVLLEGWGIKHYHHMATHCLRPDLKLVFENILKDEVRHHGGGKLIASQMNFNLEDQLVISQVLGKIIEMIKMGPISLLQCFEAVAGPLSKSEREKLYVEVGAKDSVQQNLTHLNRLMGSMTDFESFSKHHWLEPNTQGPAPLEAEAPSL